MAKKRGPGRPQTTHEQFTVRLPKGILQQIRAILGDKEKQADFVRTAIASELERREQAKK